MTLLFYYRNYFRHVTTLKSGTFQFNIKYKQLKFNYYGSNLHQ